MTSRAAKFAAVGVGRFAAHWVGDHLTGQTDKMANHKCDPGPEGTKACLAHVALYSLGSAATVLVLNKTLQLGLSWKGIVLGEAVSAFSHYYADRDRERFAQLVARTGSPAFPALGKPRSNIAAFVKARDGERLPVEVVTVGENGSETPAPFDNPSLGTGGYATDQSWHIGWTAFAAWVTAVIR